MPLMQVFVSISDPRSKRHTQHDLAELLTVVVCAVLSGADDFVAIRLWAEAKLDWLRGFMKLEDGIPSHGTVVAIDGKTSRRTASKKDADVHPLHLVSAFAAGIGVVLGQTATAEKSNEITAIPELLKTLALEGTIVTIDAMGTQTKIAQTIRQGKADYVLCVKDNHPGLLDSILFAGLDPKGKLTPTSSDEITLTKNNHGRIETRRCWAYDAVDRLYKHEQWQDLRSFAVIERERTVGERTSIERAYYISSLPADAARIARAVKSHWEVENQLHWCLDVQLNEDQSRVRTGFAANNLAIVRHIVMNLLRLNTTDKAGIKNKRLLASASDPFRAEVLGFMT